MGTFQEPDDIDFVVEGGDTDPESIQETIEYIKEYKSRPGYADELKEARAILKSLKISSPGFEMPDPDALLEQWKKCVEELERRGVNGSPEPAIGLEAIEGQ